MVYLHSICKWEAGSRGRGHTSKFKMVIDLFFYFFFTGTKFALIHVSIIRLCNKIKSKASIFQQYFLCLVVKKTVATKTIGNYVFKSLNISGVRKCVY